jgi:hypothetical protein
MKISNRLLRIINNEGISIRSFEQRIGCSNGVLSRSIQKGTDINSNWVTKIIEEFPKYSSLWLLTGNGPMLLEKESLTKFKTDEQTLSRSDSCPHCKMKDELIDSLKDQVQTLKKLVRNLEKDKKPE